MIEFYEFAGLLTVALGFGTTVSWVVMMFRSSYRRGKRA